MTRTTELTDALALYGNLPVFPYLGYAPITVERIERVIENLSDRADAKFLNSDITQEQYDAWNKALNRWANEQYAKARE